MKKIIQALFCPNRIVTFCVVYGSLLFTFFPTPNPSYVFASFVLFQAKLFYSSSAV